MSQEFSFHNGKLLYTNLHNPFPGESHVLGGPGQALHVLPHLGKKVK